MTVAPNPLVDLTNVADACAYLTSVGVAVPANSDTLQLLITAVSQQIQSWTARKFISQSYSTVLSGRGGCRLYLRNTPISAVASLSVNGLAISAAASWGQFGYIFDETTVSLAGYEFCRGVGNISISYTAGYDPIPADVVLACQMGLAAVLSSEIRDPLLSKWRAGDTEQDFAVSPQLLLAISKICISGPVTSMLSSYQRVAPA
jgi:hypothetical protein